MITKRFDQLRRIVNVIKEAPSHKIVVACDRQSEARLRTRLSEWESHAVSMSQFSIHDIEFEAVRSLVERIMYQEYRKNKKAAGYFMDHHKQSIKTLAAQLCQSWLMELMRKRCETVPIILDLLIDEMKSKFWKMNDFINYTFMTLIANKANELLLTAFL